MSDLLDSMKKSNNDILEQLNQIRLEEAKARFEELLSGKERDEPIIHKDCFFFYEEHDMGARIELCGYSDKIYNKCLAKGIDCRDCPNYISMAEVRGLVLMKLRERKPC